MNKLIPSFLLLVFISCNSEQEKIKPGSIIRDTASSIQNNDVLTIRVFNNDTIKSKPGAAGFGYDIYRNDAVYIHQPNIPAVPGNNGFSTVEDARKTASLMIYKIENNIMPPSISTQELDSLGVLK
jgi:hypothetical protein